RRGLSRRRRCIRRRAAWSACILSVVLEHIAFSTLRADIDIHLLGRDIRGDRAFFIIVLRLRVGWLDDLGSDTTLTLLRRAWDRPTLRLLWRRTAEDPLELLGDVLGCEVLKRNDPEARLVTKVIVEPADQLVNFFHRFLVARP